MWAVLWGRVGCEDVFSERGREGGEVGCVDK